MCRKNSYLGPKLHRYVLKRSCNSQSLHYSMILFENCRRQTLQLQFDQDFLTREWKECCQRWPQSSDLENLSSKSFCKTSFC